MASAEKEGRFRGGGYPFGLPTGRKPLVYRIVIVYRGVIGIGEKSSGVVEHEQSGPFARKRFPGGPIGAGREFDRSSSSEA